MDKNVEIIADEEFDIEWATGNEYSIIISGEAIGRIRTLTFTKERINEWILDDFAFYMKESTSIEESICNLMYENMGDKTIVYIDELLLNKEYRKKGIGSIALQKLEDLNINCAFMLFASAIENIYEFISNENYRNGFLDNLYKFYEKNGYKHHQSVFYKGIDFSEENWIELDNYGDNFDNYYGDY